MLRFTKGGAKFYMMDEDLSVFRMGGISQTAGKRRFDEMEKAMLDNGHGKFNTSIFMAYIHIRTFIRNVLNRINPDLKSMLITKKI